MGLEAASEACREKNDWLKPKEGTPGRKDWVSKVNWRAAERIDPSERDESGFRWEPMDREIRGELEHDSLVVKANTTMEAILGPGKDRINLQQ